VQGLDVFSVGSAERRRAVGLVPQTATDLLYLETVAEECVQADEAAGAAPGTCAGLLRRILGDTYPERHPRDLSAGQQLGLVLAVQLTGAPAAVLLDEPTRGLDYTAKRHLVEILRGLAADGRAVVVATHDVELVAQAADRVVVLADGEVVADGPTSAVVTTSPTLAPQVAKVLGAPWLSVDQVTAALAAETAVSHG
jgi:energy-coupling factor transport system ATP-binding protein